MMQGMMGMASPAMHMAMLQQMGLVPPQYLAAMQHQGSALPPPPPPPRGMAPPGGPRGSGRPAKRRRSREGASAPALPGAPGAARGSGAASSSSSSSDSSSEDSSGGSAGGMPPAAARAALAAMWPPPVGPPPGQHLDGGAAVEAFLGQCPVDPEAADRLRALPLHLQQVVMSRGPVSDTRNPSAVLIARMRDAEIGRFAGGSAGGASPPPGDFGDRGGPLTVRPLDILDDRGPKPARKSAKVTIEAMIKDFRLSPGCAWMLRALPPDKQKLASRIDPSGQADPSGYVAEQLKKIV